MIQEYLIACTHLQTLNKMLMGDIANLNSLACARFDRNCLILALTFIFISCQCIFTISFEEHCGL